MSRLATSIAHLHLRHGLTSFPIHKAQHIGLLRCGLRRRGVKLLIVVMNRLTEGANPLRIR